MKEKLKCWIFALLMLQFIFHNFNLFSVDA